MINGVATLIQHLFYNLNFSMGEVEELYNSRNNDNHNHTNQHKNDNKKVARALSKRGWKFVGFFKKGWYDLRRTFQV